MGTLPLREIRRAQLRKAPGADNITNEALRRLPPRSIAAVMRLYNGILRTGHFPNIWKTGRVIMIPKPGKNVVKAESYRPISLLPTLSKVFEKLLLRHLAPHISPRAEQFDFRAEHSTTLQLVRVLHHMTVAWNKKENTVAVFLDMEKAFDRVWHEGLLYKIATSTAPRRLTSIVAAFLRGRSFVVAVEDATSSARPIAAGVPQGSCLSPVLYARVKSNVTVDDKYLLPNINDLFDMLGKSTYFTTLDLASGYHQIEVREEDRSKTAFSTPFGHYEFNRMPFGLKTAPATFQRAMDNVLRGLQGLHCLVYLDDVIIFSKSLNTSKNENLFSTDLEKLI